VYCGSCCDMAEKLVKASKAIMIFALFIASQF